MSGMRHTNKHEHTKKHTNYLTCQIADGPVVRHDPVAEEDRGCHALHMDLGYTGSLAILTAGLWRMPWSQFRSLLLPWAKTNRTKEPSVVLEATGAILDEISAHTDRGG